MTERREPALWRERHACRIGPSGLHWTADGLTIDIEEIAAPLPRRVRGRVRLSPEALSREPFPLDRHGRHVWWPIAPRARVEVMFDDPGLRWLGSGYLDTNAGSEPLASGFQRWDWSRADIKSGAAVLYGGVCRDGSPFSLGLRFDRSGVAEAVEAPPPLRLPAAPIWRMPRQTRADSGECKVRRTLEDTPFYARSVLDTRIFGERTAAVHESLSLDRFSNPIVQMMLPFRMPRTLR